MSASMSSESTGPAQAKKALLFTAGAALQKYGEGIRDEQEVLMHLSNMVMEVFAMDTAIHRFTKKSASGPQADIMRTYVNDAMSRVEFSAKQVLAAVADGDTLRMQLGALRRLLRWMPINTVQARQHIADFLIDHGRYAL
jgi:hypothetical protein